MHGAHASTRPSVAGLLLACLLACSRGAEPPSPIRLASGVDGGQLQLPATTATAAGGWCNSDSGCPVGQRCVCDSPKCSVRFLVGMRASLTNICVPAEGHFPLSPAVREAVERRGGARGQ